MKRCCVCSSPFPDGDGKSFTVDEAEKKVIREKMGAVPLDTYDYCTPCWRALSTPKMSARILSGLAETHLNRLGVRGAEKLALNYYANLLERAQRR